MAFSSEDIQTLVAFGREQGAVEFKSPGPRSDPALRAKMIRGVLAMANRRDGGTVIVGVAEVDGALQVSGLSTTDAATWKHDHLADSLAEYADPRVSFASYTIEIDRKTVLVIEVNEFSDVPVICKRSYQDGKTLILRDGAVYVRSNRKPESREVANHDEMRQLLDIATDKGVRDFVIRARAAGLETAAQTTGPADSDKAAHAAAAFLAERGEL